MSSLPQRFNQRTFHCLNTFDVPECALAPMQSVVLFFEPRLEFGKPAQFRRQRIGFLVPMWLRCERTALRDFPAQSRPQSPRQRIWFACHLSPFLLSKRCARFCWIRAHAQGILRALRLGACALGSTAVSHTAPLGTCHGSPGPVRP